jgi:hypothetical protein
MQVVCPFLNATSAVSLFGGTRRDVVTREQLDWRFDALPEERPTRVGLVLDFSEADDEVVGLLEGWGRTATGETMPNVLAALCGVRSAH